MNRMQKARAKMLIKHPFFATLLMSTPSIETREVPTAATDMAKLYYNPDFIDSLDSDDAVLTVLAHEVMHIALEHGLRLNARNPMLWNIAADFAINLVLKDSGFEPLGNNWLLDDQYKGMSADAIYEKLQKQADQARKQGKSGQPGDGVPGPGPMGGDIKPAEGAGDPAEEAKLRRSVQQRVAQAASVARMAGRLSGELERLVGEILEPQVPWKDLLRDYMMRSSKDDETWSRRNRRFQNVYLPTRYSERMGEIIFIGDTSGSISPAELDQVAAEIQAVADQVKPERIRAIWADTKVAAEQVFEEGEFFATGLKPGGGGGTDMRVPLEYVEQYEPQVVVLCTDGYTPWPDVEPPYPLIVCCSTDVEVPVGMVIRIGG